ncbi:aminopeptidase [Haloplanus sp. C73]|uniref:aminopeptidase n=1 Tax=Haloplanus sp. C73 TaxID=3421641 RepID=UPI003EBFD0D4
MTDALREAAETAVHQCMALGSEEACAVVTDDERLSIGEALYDVASDVTDDAVLLRYPPGEQHGTEPPAPVAAAMAGADVVLAPTTKSLSHTRARREACDGGTRAATLPGVTEDVMIAGLDADYETIARHCREVLDQVADADEIRVTTPAGTDLTVEPGAREWRTDTGMVHDAGGFSNLPAGEVFVSPETAEGTYIVDGTIMSHGLIDDPIRFEVEDGYVTHISDDVIREQVEAGEAEVGRAATNFAELGIGTNVGVTDLLGSALIDEKAAGTVHVAIGDDSTIGGDTEAPLHLDCVARDPTVYVDGDEIALPTP